MTPLKKPVRHFINSDSGGLARYAEQLVQAQTDLSQRPFELYGPIRGLNIPQNIIRQVYHRFRSRWGLNQWKFACQSPLHGLDKGVIRHYHNFGFGSIDIFTAHGLYGRHWLVNNDPGQKTSFRSRFQFEASAALEKWVLNKARIVVFLSTDVREYVEQEMHIHRPGSFTVILPGVDGKFYNSLMRIQIRNNRKKYFPGLDSESRWILFVGNDFKGKGFLRLLDGLKRFEKQNTLGTRVPTDFLVFGADRQNKRNAQQVAQSLLTRVRFFGTDAYLIPAYALCDIFVMDSLSEGFPLVLLESMSAGCVPFVTRFPGVSDVVQHGTNGWVGRNAYETMAKALSIHPMELGQMSIRAAETARQRTWQRAAEQYEEVYDGL